MPARLTARVRRPRGRATDTGALAGSVLLSVFLAVVSLRWPRALPLPTVLSVPLLVGGLLLPGRVVRVLIGAAAGLVVLAALVVWPRAGQPPSASLITLGLATVVAGELARRQERLGRHGSRPEVILGELRERLGVQGELPVLPGRWRAESDLRPAYGASFAGDFLVSTLAGDGRSLELALVDVSGKGAGAGTRALLLSGAMGGLLGSVPPERFLSETNRYLMRQRWGGGFASAVHLNLDLVTGRYLLESAGHPPAAHYDAGSGAWRMSDSSGPLLGVRTEVSFRPYSGRMAGGDLLLLYTDGVVEAAGQEVDLGVDRLLGQTERLIPGSRFDGGAKYLLDVTEAPADDDRALVLIWREC